MEGIKYPAHLVFGLDIGTRSLVGTVGYKKSENQFIVIAQSMKEHETRAMLDGQIHDIPKVSESIAQMKRELEEQVGRELNEVCIAAAGRVLKTVTAKAEYEFQTDTVITDEHIHSLDLIGVEHAYESIRDEVETDEIKFYCVGYTTIKYYMNDYPITNLEGHKTSKISAEILATFLPDEVIDGLYSAVERAGLYVENLTLEPIAAINVAIPEKFRLLNIALVDVGAGTSDISITKDGSIIAYGMIPSAGDEITDTLVQRYLVEFNEAEKIKTSARTQKQITYSDIMGLSQKVSAEEVIEFVKDPVEKITKAVAEKIIELNGGKSVSAVFVVGGGGKVPGFTESLAKFLNLSEERVALRGEEVLGAVEFLQPDIQKDPLLVTPIGICLNHYDQKNNFLFVSVNGQRVKLYDNSKLTIVDAAMQLGFPNEKLFPKRGLALNFLVNDSNRFVRGELGEAAVVLKNGKEAGINSPIEANDKIEIKESTTGADAVYEIRQLPEYNGTIEFVFNDKKIVCPKFVMVNNELVSGNYEIKEKDNIIILNYYTLGQVIEFMDIEYNGQIEVNNVVANLSEKVYENFSIKCDLSDQGYQKSYEEHYNFEQSNEYSDEEEYINGDGIEKEIKVEEIGIRKQRDINFGKNIAVKPKVASDIFINVNGDPVKLSGKSNYIFVDIFDFYPFDTSVARGTELITTVNGYKAEFTGRLEDNDIIEIYWKE